MKVSDGFEGLTSTPEYKAIETLELDRYSFEDVIQQLKEKKLDPSELIPAGNLVYKECDRLIAKLHSLFREFRHELGYRGLIPQEIEDVWKKVYQANQNLWAI